MKIVCPECEAAYEIDVPDSPSKDLSAKCAVCDTKFPIKKRTLAKSNHADDSMAGPPLAQIDSGLASESNDDFLSGLQNDLKGLEDLNPLQEESLDDKNLDTYLDQLMEEEPGEPGQETLDDPKAQPATDSAPPTSDMPSEDDLDHLFDSLIAEEIKSPALDEATADSSTAPEIDQEEEDLDALLDEIILNNLDEKEEPKADFDKTELIDSELPIEETEELDASVSDSLEDAGQEIDTPEPENFSSEETDVVSSKEEDLLAKTSSEEKTSGGVDSTEDSKETLDDAQETAESTPAPELQEAEKESADPEPATEQPEDEKSDEDLWAEAFADQEATVNQEAEKEAADPEPTAEQPEDEKSDEDLWAEAFADQETTVADQQAEKESADPEPTAEPQEEEKSDEDLWAEAFADQEATVNQEAEKEAADPEPTAEPQEEEKSDEMSEAADPGEEEGAEETVTAEAEMESEEETNSEEHADSEEDDEPGEDTETNEFGISEADYDDDNFDDDEFSPPEKKKSGFSFLPSTRTGKLIVGGGVLAVLLTGGGAYFALQTLAPPELTKMTKNTSEVPEGLKPKDLEENPATQNPSENASAPAEKSNPALDAALGTSESPPLSKESGNSNSTNPSSEAETSPGISDGLVAALAPSNHAVQLATIMPVAYNINDIRVLSFNLEAEMSDAESAQVIREALPVFEKITVTTVEKLLDKKFFNDILYVKEKLKKDLQNNFNKTLEGGGRVKKITFKEFTVQ